MLFLRNSWIIAMFITENGCLENVSRLKKILPRGKGRKRQNLKPRENFDPSSANLTPSPFNSANIRYSCPNIPNNYLVRGFVGEVQVEAEFQNHQRRRS